jgi:hypothetical protein
MCVDFYVCCVVLQFWRGDADAVYGGIRVSDSGLVVYLLVGVGPGNQDAAAVLAQVSRDGR